MLCCERISNADRTQAHTLGCTSTPLHSAMEVETRLCRLRLTTTLLQKRCFLLPLLVSLVLCTRVKSFAAGTESLVSTTATTTKTAMEKMAPLCKIFPHLGFHFQKEGGEREIETVRVTAWNELRSERMANPTPEGCERHCNPRLSIPGSLCQRLQSSKEADRVRCELGLTANRNQNISILMNRERLGPRKMSGRKGKEEKNSFLLPSRGKLTLNNVCREDEEEEEGVYCGLLCVRR